MSIRVHTSSGPPDLYLGLMTAAQVEEEFGGEWEEEELATPGLWLVLADGGNGEAWVMHASAEDLTDLIDRLTALRHELTCENQPEQ